MLQGDDTRKPYENCVISIEKIHTDFLVPPQTYVLKKQLNILRELHWYLKSSYFDTSLFDLDGFLRITLEGIEESFDLLPPIIEESIEDDGSIANIVCDGMHCVYLAHICRIIPQVVFIRGVPKHISYYAYPTYTDWKDIDVRDDIPEGYIKKWHRIKDNKLLYRDFNSTFKNVGGPRGNFTKGK